MLLNRESHLLPILVGMTLLTILVFTWVFWAIWTATHAAELARQKMTTFEFLAGEIKYHDEVLTMSAKMSAQTGDPRWHERYLSHVPQLDLAIADAIQLARDLPATAAAHQTEQANLKLIEIEEQAFELVSQGQTNEASALLVSEEYEYLKHIYAKGNEKFITHLRQHIDTDLNAQKKQTDHSLIAASTTLLMTILIWIIIGKNLRSQQIKLKQLNTELEASNRSKSDFLATMSHEIRTPMNGAIGMLNLLKETKLDYEQQGYVNTALKSSDLLLTVINDILDILKLENGQIKLESIDFNIEEVVDGTLSLLSSRIKEKGLIVSTDFSTSIPMWLKGDPIRLSQIFFNLIGNAIKFTEKGNIHIEIKQRTFSNGQTALCISVEDTGIGISEDGQAKLFKRFSQSDSSITRRFGGTGLGLAICKQLIDLMDGEIGVDSTPAKGSRFWFNIPLIEGKTPEEFEPIEKPFINTPNSGKRLNILIAEDNKVNQMLIKTVLQKLGHKVDIVFDGSEAVNAVQKQSYDLIVMDIQMPNMDGISATKTIRALNAPVSSIPIIALTANALPGDRETCLKAGMDGYLSKPVQKNLLVEAIETVCPDTNIDEKTFSHKAVKIANA